MLRYLDWDWEEIRRIKKETTVEMWTRKRDEILQKKRGENSELLTSFHSSNVGKKLEHLTHAGLWNTDDSILLIEKTTEFRKLLSLSVEWRLPIKEVVVASAIPYLGQFLMREDSPPLQFEAALALAIIASISWGCRIFDLIIINRAVPMIANLLASPNDDVREQAVFALGNIADGVPKCRNLVLSHGVLTPLLAQLNEDAKPSMLKIATWTLSIICRGKPEPPIDQVKSALPALARLIHSEDEEVLINSCQALSHLSKGTNDIIQDVIEAGVCPRLVELLEHPSPSVLIYALKIVGYISIGDDTHTQSALPALAHLIHSDEEDVLFYACRALSHLSNGTNAKIQAVMIAGVCPRLVELLQHRSPLLLITALRVVSNIANAYTQWIINHQALPCLSNLLTNICIESDIKEVACCTISKITAGHMGQIQAVIEADLIGPLVNLLQFAEFDIMKEAARAISNAASGGSHEQIEYLVSQGCIKPLCDLLMYRDPRIVKVCVKGLQNIWEVGEVNKKLGITDVNIYGKMINDAFQPGFHSGGSSFLLFLLSQSMLSMLGSGIVSTLVLHVLVGCYSFPKIWYPKR